MVQQSRADFQTIEPRRDHRVYAQYVGLGAQAQEAPDDETECDSGTARVNAPAPIEIDRAAPNPLIFLARLIAILEGGIGARVVAVGLARGRRGDDGTNAYRVCLAQRVKEAFGITNVR